MTTPRQPDRTSGASPNGNPSWVGGVIMAIVVVVGGFVFMRPTSRTGGPHIASPVSHDSSSIVRREPAPTRSFFGIGPKPDDSADRAAARALTLPPPILSPTDTVPDTLQLDVDYRARQQRLCVERASGEVSAGGQGTGSATVDHIGMVNDSLAFDGAARSTTRRAMVWRCLIGTSGYTLGRMTFTSADSVPGLALTWNVIATLDDYVRRRCIVRAQALIPDKTVAPRMSGRRHDDTAHLVGVAEGGGVGLNWSCDATVRGNDVVSFSARVGG